MTRARPPSPTASPAPSPPAVVPGLRQPPPEQPVARLRPFIAQLEAAPTTTGQGEPVGLELFLVREPEGWRVDEVRQ